MADVAYLVGRVPAGSTVEVVAGPGVFAFLPDGSAKLFAITFGGCGLTVTETTLPPISLSLGTAPPRDSTQP